MYLPIITPLYPLLLQSLVIRTLSLISNIVLTSLILIKCRIYYYLNTFPNRYPATNNMIIPIIQYNVGAKCWITFNTNDTIVATKRIITLATNILNIFLSTFFIIFSFLNFDETEISIPKYHFNSPIVALNPHFNAYCC